jgi:hypothetical protein
LSGDFGHHRASVTTGFARETFGPWRRGAGNLAMSEVDETREHP